MGGPEFDSIGNVFGKTYYSPNYRYVLLKASGDLTRPGVIQLSETHTKKVLFKVEIVYPDHLTVSNNGTVLGWSNLMHLENSLSYVFCIDSNGVSLFNKKSYTGVMATAINDAGDTAAIAFAGEESAIECYSILIFDVNKEGMAVQLIPIKNRATVYHMEFNKNNNLVVNGGK